MKNIYLSSTSNPSKIQLQKVTKELLLYKDLLKEDAYTKPVDMFITSNEEIKEGDWLLIIDDFETYVHKHKGDNLPTTYHKKIILTTDQNLIKDGVQAIDDEFLEWFVKNPSCDGVEINYQTTGLKEGIWQYYYKILIPKPTQQIIDEDFDGGLTMGQIIPKEETICIQTGLPCGITCFSEEVCNKNFYTEEDVKNAFLDGWQLRDGDLPFPKAKKKWFNEFKNK